MQIENLETEVKPDWSPSAAKPTESRKNEKLDPFRRAQRAVLLQLREEIIDTATKVATSSRLSNGETLLFKSHQADSATETYDREFALGLLSHGKTALYEIDEALRRIEGGTYGICEMSGKPIPRDRLKVIPFARFTVECQSQVEKEIKALPRTQRGTPSYLPNNSANEQLREAEEVSTTEEKQIPAA